MIYLFAATGAEARATRRGASDAQNPCHGQEGISGDSRVKVVVTGIGPQAAGFAMRSVAAGLNRAAPRAFLVTGTCGALIAAARETEVVTYSECLFTSSGRPERVTTDSAITERVVQALRTAGIESQSVCGITSPEVAATRHDKQRLAATGASVVDMESYVILAAARQMAVPAVVLRVVSDGADREVPDFTRAFTPEGGVNWLAAAAIASAAPLATARLILAQRRALRRLSLALEAALRSDCWPDAS